MTTTLIHHSAGRGGLHPPNSISGLKACQEARARIVEVDITLLSDGGFALLHGPRLERETNGSGLVAACSAEEIGRFQRVWKGSLTNEPVGMLDEALALIAGHAFPLELQLDLKPDVVLDQETLSLLVDRLAPVRDRVRVTSVADWAVRRLRALDADLPLGFDPLLYLDVPTDEERSPTVPPFRLGAYGYLDDHPLSSRRWGEPAAYLAARAEALWAQAPAGVIWYISAYLLERVLDEGFDWMAYLHHRGAEVDAWTLDPDTPDEVARAQRLVAAGVDRITSNDPVGLISMLAGQAIL
jgi:glycerophosphoryl diester phosphodiesterase